jgi:hypothetical protein
VTAAAISPVIAPNSASASRITTMVTEGSP